MQRLPATNGMAIRCCRCGWLSSFEKLYPSVLKDDRERKSRNTLLLSGVCKETPCCRRGSAKKRVDHDGQKLRRYTTIVGRGGAPIPRKHRLILRLFGQAVYIRVFHEEQARSNRHCCVDQQLKLRFVGYNGPSSPPPPPLS